MYYIIYGYINTLYWTLLSLVPSPSYENIENGCACKKEARHETKSSKSNEF